MDPITRLETFLQGAVNAAQGNDVGSLPDPITREETYLDALVEALENGSGGLPEVTSADNGKVAGVVNGEWTATEIPEGNMPVTTEVDEFKVARVGASGNWGTSDLSDIVGPARVMASLHRNIGFLNGSCVWKYTTDATYKHIVLPVSGGESLTVTANASRAAFIVALKTYSVVQDDTADLSTETGWTGRVQINSGNSASYTLPSDARYLYVAMLSGGNDCSPAAISLDGVNLEAASTADALIEYANGKIAASESAAKQREIELFRDGGVDAPIVWELGTVNANSGVGYPVTDYASTSRWRGKGIFKFAVPLDVTCDPDYRYQVYLLDASGNLVSTAFEQISKDPYRIPANTPFRIICGKAGSPAPDISDVDIAEHIAVRYTVYAEMVDDRYNNGVRWCAMGDSITEGYYSYLNDEDQPTNAKDASKAWVTKVSKTNRWDVTNLGDGGTGWLNEDEYGGCAYKLARVTDFSGYNLVTLAYGINDWKGNSVVHTTDNIPNEIAADVSEVVTPTTVIQAMKITIEAILASNPKCKVIGILPINCSKYGTKANNYGLGYTDFANTGTLESFCEVLAKIYEYYGIQYIDMVHASVVNRENIETLLIDGVHPSEDCYTLMAHELAKKITF